MNNNKRLAEFIRRKGAVHWREVEAYLRSVGELGPASEPAKTAARLGALLSTGVLSTPWTSQRVPYVWYRHKDVKFQTAGKLRAESRKEFPDLWPPTKRQQKTRKHKEELALLEESLMLRIFGCIQENGPIKLEILGMYFEDELGKDALTRRLHLLQDEGSIAFQVTPKKRGRPAREWYALDQTPDAPEDKPAESVRTKARRDPDASAVLDVEVDDDGSWMD